MGVSSGLLLDAALSLRMAASGALREGNTFTARIFDPSSTSRSDIDDGSKIRAVTLQAPSATGREGSDTHSLQEPA